jgi:DNA polymerase-3 subunit alpha/error-prone DNA polymerase
MLLQVQGPDINKSRWRYYGKGDTVIVGLMAIKGISKNGAEDIVKERERGGDFQSLQDFIRRVRLSRDDIIALCPAGVFDSIAEGRERTLQARTLLGANTSTGQSGKGQVDLFAAEPLPKYQDNSVAVPEEPSLRMGRAKKKLNTSIDELWGEYGVLSFLRKVHPLVLWKDTIIASKRVKAIHIGEYVGNHVRLVGWPITQKEVWTKDGLTMSFLTFEDETALFETVIFPNVYDKYNRLLFDQRPLWVYGKVMEDWGAVSLEVTKIELLSKK